MTIALRIEPEDLTVDPGSEAVFIVHVVNRSGVVDRVALDLLGTAAAWGQLEPRSVALMPGTDATATLVLRPPIGTALGPVPIGIRATAETSGFVEVGEAKLNVGASRTVEAELRPRTVTGKRRATSVIVLHNRGNAATKVQMVASDPDDAIVFEPPRPVQVGAGMTAEVPLRMRLPVREKQGATLPYQVLVEGGDTGQSLDGQVRQPAKKRWPLMAAMLALALIVAGIILLKPKDSVALKDGKADAPTTLAATTTVAGVTTVPGAPTTTGGAATTAAVSKGTTATTTGGGATTVIPTVTAGGGAIGGIVPVQRTTVPALPCGPKGTPLETAQRVICAWEVGRLTEVADSTTPEAVADLSAITHVSGQKGTAVTDATGTTVSFDNCGIGKGVKSVRIPTTTPSFAAGRVYRPVVPCPTSTAGTLTTAPISS